MVNVGIKYNWAAGGNNGGFVEAAIDSAHRALSVRARRQVTHCKSFGRLTSWPRSDASHRTLPS